MIDEIVIGPLLALLIGILSLFYDKSKSQRKWLLFVLLLALCLTCGVEVYSKYSNRIATNRENDRNKKTIIELSLALRNFREDTNNSFQNIAGLISKQKEMQNEKVSVKPIINGTDGWAYYGLYIDGKWAVRDFNNTSDQLHSLPKVNDVVYPIKAVNARQGYTESGSKGWIYKPVIGVIKPEDRLLVLSIRHVFDYIWIQFKII